MNSSCLYEGPSSLFGILSKTLNDIWLSEKSPLFVGPNRNSSASILDQSDVKSIPPRSKMRADAFRVLDEAEGARCTAFYCSRFVSLSLPAGAIYDAGPWVIGWEISLAPWPFLRCN